MESHQRFENDRTLSSPLELLHPDGGVERVRLLGSACPPELARDRPSPTGPALVVLAPSVGECLRRGWLEEAVRTLAASVDDRSLAYVLVPVGWRRRTVALARSAGLAPVRRFLHLPSLRDSAHIVPLEAEPLRHAIGSLMVTRRWKRRLAALAFADQWLTARLLRLLPSSGFVLARRVASPLCSWMARADPEAGELNAATLSVGRGGASAVLYAFFGQRDDPSLVAKVGLTERTRKARAHEASILPLLFAGVSAAGADAPSVIGAAGAPEGTLLETALTGRQVAALLVDEPRLLPEVLTAIAQWLERWHLQTRGTASLDEQLVETVLAPARAIASDLPSGHAYVQWLERLCARQLGLAIPLVAAHNDLTMVNVLRRPDGRLGVVDWEVAEGAALPLTDFFYAVGDAVAAISRYADRATAFREAFLAGNETRSLVSSLRADLCERLQLEPPFVELCFHACWLRHAANEKELPEASAKRPFLGIVRLLAAAMTTSTASAAVPAG